jgi:hypothetical protein
MLHSEQRTGGPLLVVRNSSTGPAVIKPIQASHRTSGKELQNALSIVEAYLQGDIHAQGEIS